MKVWGLVALLLLIVVSPVIVYAQAPAAGTAPAPINTAQDVADFLCGLISWFFWIVIIISVIMVLWAAYTYVTASDDAEKTTKARKILTYAAIGIAVAVIAVGFPGIVSTLFPSTGTGGVGLETACPNAGY